jgi:hypothetical protein
LKRGGTKTECVFDEIGFVGFEKTVTCSIKLFSVNPQAFRVQIGFISVKKSAWFAHLFEQSGVRTCLRKDKRNVKKGNRHSGASDRLGPHGEKPGNDGQFLQRKEREIFPSAL